MTNPEKKSSLITIPIAQSAITPMEMLNQAIERGANIDILTKLMDLQERWEKNQNRKEFDAAIAEAKSEISPIVRNRKGHNSKYADFSAIAKAIDQILSKNGLSYRFRTAQTDRISVTCILSHRAGHSEETTLSGPADKSGSKNDIQAIGSTLTYLQRYSLVQALGLASSDDDDGNLAGSGEKISEEQVDQIQALIVETDSDIPRFLKYFAIESIDKLPAKKFQPAIDMLNKKRG